MSAYLAARECLVSYWRARGFFFKKALNFLHFSTWLMKLNGILRILATDLNRRWRVYMMYDERQVSHYSLPGQREIEWPVLLSQFLLADRPSTHSSSDQMICKHLLKFIPLWMVNERKPCKFEVWKSVQVILFCLCIFIFCVVLKRLCISSYVSHNLYNDGDTQLFPKEWERYTVRTWANLQHKHEIWGMTEEA